MWAATWGGFKTQSPPERRLIQSSSGLHATVHKQLHFHMCYHHFQLTSGSSRTVSKPIYKACSPAFSINEMSIEWRFSLRFSGWSQ